ncbi:tripartite motif-containing protein 2-like [Ruditapes philippinarum]|uniref:tripartite motif-containing protein 2-like n=1 Tax=Ruditapes philippinarum TaxID=129788 RepID=UPI00295C0C84|nr:tripartite motif-containing protein 2-like [Ruditapes philippinarum]
MTGVLKKCKSLVFGPGLFKNDDDRRRTTSENCSDKELLEEIPEYNKTRRVTFADIGELHTKFAPKSTWSLNGGGVTNVGYIHRNCAEHIPLKNEQDILQESESPAESVMCHVSVLQTPDGTGKLESRNCDPLELTFGKRGKDIGEFQDATGIIYISRDQILVTDMVNNRLQMCNISGETSTVYSGDDISEPWDACTTNNGHIAFTSRRRKCVVIMSKEGDILWSFGANFFDCPCGICIDADGNFIVTDVCLNRVSIHDNAGQFLKYLGNPKIAEQQFSKPRYVCSSSCNDLIVSDSGNHRIKLFDKNGHFIRSIGKFGKGDGELKTPYGICNDSFGHILVADHYNNRVSMFTREGAFVCHVIEERYCVKHPKGLALSPDLNLFVTSGNLKACEIKVYKLKCSDPTVIVHV